MRPLTQIPPRPRPVLPRSSMIATAAPPSPPDIPGGLRAMSDERPASILFVDDDPANRLAFSTVLRARGFTTREAATGGDALRLAAERPDLIILDVNLPDIDGFEVCRRIKAHPATSSIPVLHMSAVYVRIAGPRRTAWRAAPTAT